MLAAIAKLLRLASFVICLIVIASFVVFAANQTKSASNEQQEVISGAPTAPAGGTPGQKATRPHKNAFHKALDEASGELTSPFAGIFSGSHSQWGTRGGELVLALLVYGFGLGFVARILRVRA